jgi:hypothetical protein
MTSTSLSPVMLHDLVKAALRKEGWKEADLEKWLKGVP